MSFKALLATLIVTSSSLALADPIVRDHRDATSYDRGADDTRVRDHRDDRAAAFDRVTDDARMVRADGVMVAYDRTSDDVRVRDHRAPIRRRKIVLANDLVLSGREPAFISLDGQPRGITRLALQLESGRAFIDSVLVTYDDGHREAIAVKQLISDNEPTLTIDLSHAGATSIGIATTQMRNARGGGMRRRSSATVDVIGILRR